MINISQYFHLVDSKLVLKIVVALGLMGTCYVSGIIGYMMLKEGGTLPGILFVILSMFLLCLFMFVTGVFV